MKRMALGLAACLAAAAAGCGGGGHGGGDGEDPSGAPDAHVSLGEPTGALCLGGTTLTYETFGRDFMEAYCLRCHSAALTGDDRHGAPLAHDFDTQLDCQGLASHIDRAAGAGPDAVNDAMPPAEPRPTLEERYMLSEWLACGGR